MKIELIEEVGYDGTWYNVKVDAVSKYFRSKLEAMNHYNITVKNASVAPVITVLKSTTI